MEAATGVDRGVSVAQHDKRERRIVRLELPNRLRGYSAFRVSMAAEKRFTLDLDGSDRILRQKECAPTDLAPPIESLVPGIAMLGNVAPPPIALDLPIRPME